MPDFGAPEFGVYERRIAEALARTRAALEAQGPAGQVEAALAEAEAARAEAAKATSEAAAARAEVAQMRQALDAEAHANAQLRDRVATLKEMKDALAAELAEREADGARVAEARAADRVELDALIAALEPLVEDQTHA